MICPEEMEQDRGAKAPEPAEARAVANPVAVVARVAAAAEARAAVAAVVAAAPGRDEAADAGSRFF